MNKDRTFDLRERLLDYAVRIVKLSESLPATRVGAHIAGQILRSGTSTAANYAEAQSAESKTDFVHKLKVALKELRETNIWLRIICKADLIVPNTMLAPLLKETDDLMAILFTSIVTAKKRKS